jgi:chromosome segregation ATPase
MIKQQADARRAVTETDLQLVDKAIADHETFQKDLYVLRRVLSDVGNLDQQYRSLKEGIAAVQAEGARISSELEAVKTRLATVQREESEKRKVVAELDREIAEKERMLSAFSSEIDRITGKAA